MTFPESLEAHRRTFLEALKIRHCSPATIRCHDQSLSAFFRYLAALGLDDLREVQRQTIADFRPWAAGQGNSISTVQSRLVALRRFFEHLEATDAILLNPALNVLLPRRAQRLPKKVLSQSEVKTILDTPDTQTRKGIRDRAILELFYSTGIRLEEMARLTVHDVDYRHGFLRVNKGKFAKDRVVPLGSKACDYVREYLQKVRLEWSKTNRDERALWLSPIQPHQPVRKECISLMVRQVSRAAGIPAVSAHVWRHTCATHLVADGANVAYVQRLLGHRSINTTQIYTRVSAPELKKTLKTKHPRERQKL